MKPAKHNPTVETVCPDCGAMLKIDAQTGADLETAAKAMREQDDRKESIFRQSIEAEKNKEDLFEKKFAEALRKAKDAPAGKPLREFDLD
jgi:DNA-directed RNA polymerase subunit M/transcription elongation factor TFIIS